MRNPDPGDPPGGDGDEESPDGPRQGRRRRAALVGLAVIALLVVGGLVLSHTLHRLAEMQDCALSGRSNCDGDR